MPKELSSQLESEESAKSHMSGVKIQKLFKRKMTRRRHTLKKQVEVNLLPSIDGDLTQEETVRQQSTGWSCYKHYLKALGWIVLVLAFIAMNVTEGLQLGSNL